MSYFLTRAISIISATLQATVEDIVQLLRVFLFLSSRDYNVMVYPNPFDSYTTIAISPAEKQEGALLKVYDIYGRENNEYRFWK